MLDRLRFYYFDNKMKKTFPVSQRSGIELLWGVKGRSIREEMAEKAFVSHISDDHNSVYVKAPLKAPRWAQPAHTDTTWMSEMTRYIFISAVQRQHCTVILCTGRYSLLCCVNHCVIWNTTFSAWESNPRHSSVFSLQTMLMWLLTYLSVKLGIIKKKKKKKSSSERLRFNCLFQGS